VHTGCIVVTRKLRQVCANIYIHIYMERERERERKRERERVLFCIEACTADAVWGGKGLLLSV